MHLILNCLPLLYYSCSALYVRDTTSARRKVYRYFLQFVIQFVQRGDKIIIIFITVPRYYISTEIMSSNGIIILYMFVYFSFIAYTRFFSILLSLHAKNHYNITLCSLHPDTASDGVVKRTRNDYYIASYYMLYRRAKRIRERTARRHL